MDATVKITNTSESRDVAMVSDGETQILRPGESDEMTLVMGRPSDPIRFAAGKIRKEEH